MSKTLWCNTCKCHVLFTLIHTGIDFEIWECGICSAKKHIEK